MIYDTSYSLAIKNDSGKYIIREFSLFNLINLNKAAENLVIDLKNKELNIKLKCHLCEGYHCYKYSLKQLKTCKFIIGGCVSLGEAIFIIGKNEDVRDYVDKKETMIKRYMKQYKI
ncbi:MAG: hypothetical protein AB6733_01535 [Clostridiaceae bacterium]